MNMIDTIKQVPNYQTLTAQQIVDYMGEQVVTSDPTPYNAGKLQAALSAQFGEALGFDYANVVLGSIREGGKTLPLLEGAYLAMNTGEGISLDQDFRQTMIDQLGADWPAGLVDAVKALGRPAKVRAQVMGLGAVPTAEEVQAALDADNVEPDAWDNEILFSLNKSQGSLNVFARITPVGVKNGVVVKRGEAVVKVNNELLGLAESIIAALAE